jgi:hypothetical protein
MPARLRDVDTVLRALGGYVDESGGKHNYKARLPGKRVFPIPAHRGWQTQVTDRYIEGLCRTFGFDKSDFLRRLQGR